MRSSFVEEHRQQRLSVLGMRCAGCVQAVQDALSSVPGVVRAEVNFADHTASVEGDVDPSVLLAFGRISP